MTSWSANVRQRLEAALGRIHSDESGQGLFFAAISLMVLTFFAGTVYRVGFLSSTRMKVQSTADAAAFSMALTEANAMSALAWVNEGVAQTQYHLMRYAVDVVVTAVDLEYAKPGPRSPGRRPDPNVDPNQAQQAYDDAYDRAQESIPAGKRYLQQLSELQDDIIAKLPNNKLRSGLYNKAGAAFAMSEGHSGRRGVKLATVFPDYEDFDPTRYLENETDTERFGSHVVGDAQHPQQGSYPRWVAWFDAGIRGDPYTGVDYYTGQNIPNWRYWDTERSTYDQVTGIWDLVPRTFARQGRLFFPNAVYTSAGWPHLVEEDPTEAVELGKGYEVGDTVLKVGSLWLLKDRTGPGGTPQPQNASNPYQTPFYIQIQGRRWENDRIVNNPPEIHTVTSVNEASNELILQDGLQNEIWIWLDTTAQGPCQQYQSGNMEPGCVAKDIGGETHYFRSNYPAVLHGRYLLYTDQSGDPQRVFYPIYLGYNPGDHIYCQTRGPCWDDREILQSETPSTVLTGPTGYILENDVVRACPTCGLQGRPGVDYDGDRKTDVRLFAWHAYHRQGTVELDESDYMDVRVFEEVADPRIPDGRNIGDSLDNQNQSAYGESPASPPLVLTEEFFKWGMSAALWMPKHNRAMILPDSWEPQWGYFGLASARPAVWDPQEGKWIVDFTDEQDPQQARTDWLAGLSNLYLTDWQARLVSSSRLIQDFDKQAGYSEGINMLLDKLVNSSRTYDEQNQTYTAVMSGQAAPTPPEGEMRDVLDELMNPDNDQHGLNILDSDVEDLVHH
ncbi:MAG: Tad domain-containing protein [Planctomycetes bacterium]|nr:Tad domain-containing protein [Planctomycetota bacterium]